MYRINLSYLLVRFPTPISIGSQFGEVGYKFPILNERTFNLNFTRTQMKGLWDPSSPISFVPNFWTSRGGSSGCWTCARKGKSHHHHHPINIDQTILNLTSTNQNGLWMPPCSKERILRANSHTIFRIVKTHQLWLPRQRCSTPSATLSTPSSFSPGVSQRTNTNEKIANDCYIHWEAQAQ